MLYKLVRCYTGLHFFFPNFYRRTLHHRNLHHDTNNYMSTKTQDKFYVDSTVQMPQRHRASTILPSEMWTQILLYIDIKTIRKEVNRVCRLFYKIIEDPIFWRIRFKNLFGDSRVTEKDIEIFEERGMPFMCQASEDIFNFFGVSKDPSDHDGSKHFIFGDRPQTYSKYQFKLGVDKGIINCVTMLEKQNIVLAYNNNHSSELSIFNIEKLKSGSDAQNFPYVESSSAYFPHNTDGLVNIRQDKRATSRILMYDSFVDGTASFYVYNIAPTLNCETVVEKVFDDDNTFVTSAQLDGNTLIFGTLDGVYELDIRTRDDRALELLSNLPRDKKCDPLISDFTCSNNFIWYAVTAAEYNGDNLSEVHFIQCFDRRTKKLISEEYVSDMVNPYLHYVSPYVYVDNFAEQSNGPLNCYRENGDLSLVKSLDESHKINFVKPKTGALLTKHDDCTIRLYSTTVHNTLLKTISFPYEHIIDYDYCDNVFTTVSHFGCPNCQLDVTFWSKS